MGFYLGEVRGGEGCEIDFLGGLVCVGSEEGGGRLLVWPSVLEGEAEAEDMVSRSRLGEVRVMGV